MNSIQARLLTASKQLDSVSSTARLDAELLISHVLNKPKSYLYTWPEQALMPEQISQFEALLNRRLQGEPIAYLIGEKEFWSLDFKVTPEVLIPRPDTEILVETVLKLLPNSTCKVADLGTGSGAIAVALAHERPGWEIWATDQSEKALEVAKFNAKRHQANIHFSQGSWLSALPQQKFNAILSNPPYIAPNDRHLQTDIRFEPMTALIADNHGLKDLAEIIHTAKTYLLPKGYLVLEHGYDQADQVAELYHRAGFTHVNHVRDLAGHRRLSYALA